MKPSQSTRTRSLNACHLLLGEIANVVSALKHRSVQRGRTEEVKFGSLISGLVKLQKNLEALPAGSRGLLFLDSQDYLAPFLEVIKSEETSGPITAVALTSVLKFIKCGFLELPGSNPVKGIRSIVTTVARCRFKASDSDTDELVLYKILNLLQACLVCPFGHLITNKLVYEITQTCFKMSTQDHLSVLLRKAAEMTLLEMVRCIFSNFYGRQQLQAGDTDVGPEVWSPAPSKKHIRAIEAPKFVDETPQQGSGLKVVMDPHLSPQKSANKNNSGNETQIDGLPKLEIPAPSPATETEKPQEGENKTQNSTDTQSPNPTGGEALKPSSEGQPAPRTPRRREGEMLGVFFSRDFKTL